MLTVFLLSAIAVMATINIAVASNGNINKVSNGGYTVTHTTSSLAALRPLIVYSSITQDHTNWHYRTINGYYTSVNIDLYWGNPSNSLSLTIYTPDGYVLGPYYDMDDGVTDGQINLYVNNPNGVAQGTWTYQVYGYSVTGTQSYSI